MYVFVRTTAFAVLLLPAVLSSAGAEITDAVLETAVQKLDQLATRAMRESGVPGMAVAIVHKDRVVYLKGFGVREAGTSLRVGPDTVFQIASVSKPITSTILASLVGDGVIGWDDRIVQHDPGFSLRNEYATQHVTFRDFLCHRSGLPGHAGDLMEDLRFDRMRILNRLRYFPLEGRFRKAYAYTNYGITEAGVAAARAAGVSWDALAEQRLFAPLGMTSTSTTYADFVNSPNHAVPHVPASGDWIPNGKWAARFNRNPDAQAPAGGVSSTASDLARWMILQLNGGRYEGRQIIDEAALRETHQPQIEISADSFYGLCWNVQEQDGRHFLRHSGEFVLGVRSAVALCLDEQIGIAVVVNASTNGIPEGLDRSFFDFIFGGHLTLEWVALADEPFGKITLEDHCEFVLDVRSAVALSLDERIDIVNASTKGILEALYRSFFDSIFEGHLTRDWVAFANEKFEEMTLEDRSGDGTDYSKPSNPVVPAGNLRRFAGTYHNPVYGPARVIQRGDRLFMELGPKRMRFPLRHYSGRTFYFETNGEMASGTSSALFHGNGGGRTRVLTLNAYNHHRLGVFRR